MAQDSSQAIRVLVPPLPLSEGLARVSWSCNVLSSKMEGQRARQGECQDLSQ